MTKNKTLIVIAAIAVMLVGATNAYAYTECWNGWFNSGELTLTLGQQEYPFDYVSGQGVLEDTTNGDVDEFVIHTIPVLTFTCSGVGTIKLWAHTASGWKDTGQSGQKEAEEGEWEGMAILTITGLPPDTFDVVGTWETDDAGDYFNYGGAPPIYSAEWDMTDSEPDGLNGVGGSEGERVYFEE